MFVKESNFSDDFVTLINAAPSGVNQQAQQPQPQAPNNYPMPLQNPQYPPQAPRYPPQPNYPPQANGAIQQGFRGQPQQPVIPAQQDPRTGQVPPQPGQPGQVRGQAPGQVRGQVPVHQQPPQERPLDRKHRPLDMSDNRPDDSPQTRPKVSKQNPVKTATHTVTTTTKVPPKHTTTTAQTVETRPQQQQPYWNRQFPDSDSATDDAYYTGGGGGGAYVPGYNRNYDNAGSYTGRQQNKGIYNSGGRLYSGGRDRGYFSNLYNTGGGYGAGVVDYDPYYLDSQGQVPAAAPNVPGAAYPNSDYDYYSDNGPGIVVSSLFHLLLSSFSYCSFIFLSVFPCFLSVFPHFSCYVFCVSSSRVCQSSCALNVMNFVVIKSCCEEFDVMNFGNYEVCHEFLLYWILIYWVPSKRPRLTRTSFFSGDPVPYA